MNRCNSRWGKITSAASCYRSRHGGRNRKSLSPHWTPLCWLLRTSVRKISILCTIDQVSLPKHVRCEYNQRDPFCSYSSSNAPISRRRGSIRAWCLHLNQATSIFQLSRDPRTFFALDKAIDVLTFARNICRYDQRKIRTACGKRTVTTTTEYSPSTDQTIDIQEEGSAQFGTSDQDGPNMETGPLHCPAG